LLETPTFAHAPKNPKIDRHFKNVPPKLETNIKEKKHHTHPAESEKKSANSAKNNLHLKKFRER